MNHDYDADSDDPLKEIPDEYQGDDDLIYNVDPNPPSEGVVEADPSKASV